MSFDSDERSIDSGEPIELYLFKYNNINYTYTTAQFSQKVVINGISYVFNPDYIKRGDSLKLSDSSTSEETCTIEVNRLNSVAQLYQVAPPEQDTVSVEIFRMHGENNSQFVRILYGTIKQVSYEDSLATMTILVEDILSRNIPRGKLSYYCQNCIYDNKCTLKEKDYAHTCYIDGGMYGTRIYSSNLLEKPDGYFNDGFIKIGNTYRAIAEHKGEMIRVKYPIPKQDQLGQFVAYPGCSNLFEFCHSRFNNTDNFSGVPYILPFDVYTHNSNDTVVYWINSAVISRDTNGIIYE